jgi:hypothetical protein
VNAWSWQTQIVASYGQGAAPVLLDPPREFCLMTITGMRQQAMSY